MVKIDESNLYKMIAEAIIRESNECRHMLNEATKTLIDNFDEIAQDIDATAQQLNDSDKFWYIEVKKRFKDNPGLHTQLNHMKNKVNYDGYGQYLGNFRVKNGQELLALKPQIVSLCNNNNARAYITLNPRSEKAVKAHVSSPRFQSYFKSKVSPLANP